MGGGEEGGHCGRGRVSPDLRGRNRMVWETMVNVGVYYGLGEKDKAT